MVDSMYYPQYAGATADTMNAIQYGYYDYGWTRSVSGYTLPTGLTYEPYGSVANMWLTPAASRDSIGVKFEHDAAGRLTKQYVTNTLPSYDDAVFRRSYTYTGGDITRVDETNNSGNFVSTAQRYTYDAVGRLKTAADSSLSSPKEYRYAYDKNGNIDTMIVSSIPFTYTYQDSSNRLLRTGWGDEDYDFVYDANGCIIRDRQTLADTAKLSYDYRNLNTLVTRKVWARGSFKLDSLIFSYDYTGRRVKKRVITWEMQSPCTFKSGGFRESGQVGKLAESKTVENAGGSPGDPCDPRWIRSEYHLLLLLQWL